MSQVSDVKDGDVTWRWLYRVGTAAALIVLILFLIGIIGIITASLQSAPLKQLVHANSEQLACCTFQTERWVQWGSTGLA